MTDAPIAIRAAELNRFTQASLRASGDPGAAVVVVDRNGIVSCRGFGIDAAGAPVTCGTPFVLASLTKSVTALAIVQLSESGRIALDAPVVRYLPWFRTPNAGSERITVRQLLHQQSGFDKTSGLMWLNAPPGTTLRQRLDAVQLVALHSEPGKRFEYSNINYDVLGAIVEARSGLEYRRYVSERVLAPLGIAGARFACDLPMRGYVRVFSVPLPAPQFPELCADVPAGGLVMNARQYGRYLAAHLDAGRTWSKAALSPLGWETLHRSPPGFPYAMGWYESVRQGGVRELRHKGSAPDFQAFVAFYPSLGLGAARLANANEIPDGGRSTPIEIGLEDILRGAKPPGLSPVPPDLFWRVVVLAALAVVVVQTVRRRTARRSWILAAMNAIAAAVVLIFVLPQWAYSPLVAFLYSPDLTVLILALLAALGTATILELIRPRATT